jgi:hypothetical protein
VNFINLFNFRIAYLSSKACDFFFILSGKQRRDDFMIDLHP